MLNSVECNRLQLQLACGTQVIEPAHVVRKVVQMELHDRLHGLRHHQLQSRQRQRDLHVQDWRCRRQQRQRVDKGRGGAEVVIPDASEHGELPWCRTDARVRGRRVCLCGLWLSLVLPAADDHRIFHPDPKLGNRQHNRRVREGLATTLGGSILDAEPRIFEAEGDAAVALLKSLLEGLQPARAERLRRHRHERRAFEPGRLGCGEHDARLDEMDLEGRGHILRPQIDRRRDEVRVDHREHDVIPQPHERGMVVGEHYWREIELRL